LNKVFLLFGSNIEPRLSFLQKAERGVADLIGKICQLSSVYESDPWGFQADQRFLNRVVIVETDLSPQEVLKRVLSIESKIGRKRHKNGYSSRQIDIDILYFNEANIEEPGLIIPHPGIPVRRFTLVPLVEIAENFIHPVLKQSHAELLNLCSDNLKVRIYRKQKER